ncbi:Coiled-coil domain-containing protein [Operophtera brumata]|uniref:Dynein regulatory complex subunit 2 n=1 Tax=Operophtera brumata TaxID=104452 RepID=A0A0L7LU80_OPEBR|nr:Coiled-coil domain-containing protein [Operophtera brumata]
MGKKSKGNKLANMSDEERARYLQHRADLEEEARRRKQQLIAMFIKGMMGSFNFMVDRKNRLLASLMRALEASDEQHRRAFQAHTECVHYFLNIGSQRLDKLQTEYDFQKNSLLETWDRDEMELTDGQHTAEFNLLLMHLEWYCTQLRSVYASHLEQHRPIMAHYSSLREKDEFYQRDIARNDAMIQNATENLVNLEREWLKMTSSMHSKLTRMSNHKEGLSKNYWQMKRDAKLVRGTANKRLGIMVNASQDAISVMQLAGICTNYEHEADEAFLKDIEHDSGPVDFENLDDAMINECKEYSKMDKFMLKVNHVRVQTMCLRAEKAKLAKENVQLKHYIKRYLTELALKSKRPQSVQLQEMQKIDVNGKLLYECVNGPYIPAYQ